MGIRVYSCTRSESREVEGECHCHHRSAAVELKEKQSIDLEEAVVVIVGVL